jgi:hypothetical protein
MADDLPLAERLRIALGAALLPFAELDDRPSLHQWHPCVDTPACRAAADPPGPCACSGIPYLSDEAWAALRDALAEHGIALAPASGPQLMCLVCMYVRPRPGLDEDALAELEVLTVLRGQMVCLRHAGCVSGDHHWTLTAAVEMESGGRIASLSEYQSWRSAQDLAGAR